MSDELKLEVPTLTIGEEVKAEEAAPLQEVDIEDKIELTPEEQKAVDEFVNKIDLSNATHILQYGADAQQKMADFSDSALESVRTKDLGTVGDTLTGLVTELKGFDALEEKKGIMKLFHKAADPIARLKTKYDKAESNVEKVVEILEGHQVTLTRDIAVLDELFKANTINFKQLSMYIVAGKKKLEEAYNVTLPELKAKAEASGSTEDAQAANDFAQMCNRFEKKLHDLELTRMISLQTAPQIRMIQNNDTVLVEKIQTSVLNTIPLWKNQMVLTLGIENSRRAMEAQRQVTDMTNALLQKNADMLHMASVETAKESERGIVDMETLKHTNEQLISTLDEVLQIQTDGAKKRQEAEQELRRLEGELKQKLLQPRS